MSLSTSAEIQCRIDTKCYKVSGTFSYQSNMKELLYQTQPLDPNSSAPELPRHVQYDN